MGWGLLVLGILCWGLAPAAQAEICALDTVPAATLLLPYFEVDLDAVDGVTTLMSVGNSSPSSQLARITLWTDMALPTAAFDLYLTGFDVTTINLRDLVVSGILPGNRTFEDPGDLSFPNPNLAGCGQDPDVIPPGYLAALQDAHTGRSSALFGGLCAGSPMAPLDTQVLAKGFVTVDVVSDCSVLYPGEEGYFGPDGIALDDNVLWGDFFYVDPANNFAQGDALVRLEASPDRFGPGDRTFYSFLVGGDGSDHREPLPSIWSTRYLSGGAFSGGTSLVAWRGPVTEPAPFICTSNFGFDPVPSFREAYAFDEEESVVGIYPLGGIIDPPPPPIDVEPLPFYANRVRVEDWLFPPPWDFGWLSFDLRSREPFGVTHPMSQAWLGATFDASGQFSVGFQGTHHDSPCSIEGCALGDRVPAGQVCLRPLAGGSDQLNVGDSALLVIFPAGCYSTSCTQVFDARCSVLGSGNQRQVISHFCLSEDTSGAVGCTADCSGGGTAGCSFSGLGSGEHTVQVDDLTLEFSIPTTVPPGGICTGSQF